MDLSKVLANIRATIPEPYRPPPTPQKSWQGLKVGQVVQFKDGQTAHVESCDSQGITFMGLWGRWEDPQWRDHFSIVKKSRKKTVDNPTLHE